MIVGIEPLGHFHRNHINTIFLVATRHSKIQRQCIGIFQGIIPLRDGAEHMDMVESDVIKRKIARRNLRNTSIALALPVVGAQGFGLLFQDIGRNFAFPIAFKCFF